MKLFNFKIKGEGNISELFKVALPMIFSTSAWSIQHFVDRMFLSQYSPEAIAASMPAGMLNFSIMSFFLGTAGYVSTFIAQYFGAKKYEKIGHALWQGFYICLIGWAVELFIMLFAENIFTFAGHSEDIIKNEIIYFQILCIGTGPALISSTFSAFFTGRGKTAPVMVINIVATAFNLILDYFLIFGHGPFPEMGISGAAIATALSGVLSLLLFSIAVFTPKNNLLFNVISGWKPDKSLFIRIVKFGYPNGAEFIFDTMGFTVFVILVGSLGTVELAATNIAFNINTLAFFPMLGMSMAVSVIVGQYIGANKPDISEKTAYSGFSITIIYLTFIASLYVIFPEWFTAPFKSENNTALFNQIEDLTIILLRFVAFFSIFDAFNLVFGGAIKGAGDTAFAMKAIFFNSLLVLVIPSILMYKVFSGNVYTGWTIVTLYVMMLGIIFFTRFKSGKWKKMSVIETETVAQITTVSAEHISISPEVKQR